MKGWSLTRNEGPQYDERGGLVIGRPADLKGTSGSGVWRVHLPRGAEDEVEEVELAGIVTAQLPPEATDKHGDILIGHDPWDILGAARALDT